MWRASHWLDLVSFTLARGFTMSAHFALYGAPHNGLYVEELLDMQRKDGMLFARAEQSGSEGTYVEVAIWNSNHRQWQRYAFMKCFGGEHKELPDAGSIQTARRFADDINQIMYTQDVSFSIVHNMPQYTNDPACCGASGSPLLDFAKEMVGYLEMKVTGFKMDYPDNHCMVITAQHYLDQAKALVDGEVFNAEPPVFQQ